MNYYLVNMMKNNLLRVLIINYGIEGDPHAYFLKPEDDYRSIWKVITQRELFDLYSFFERHLLINGEYEVSLETLIKDLPFEEVNMHNSDTGEEQVVLAIEFHCQEVVFDNG